MSTVGSIYLDLAEMRKGELNGSAALDVINIMAQTNAVLDDAVYAECNDGSSHENTVLSGLPKAAWGRLYKGIQADRATRTKVTDTTGFLEAKSEVDTRLKNINKNLPMHRLQEAHAHIEGMGQEMARAIFYESSDVNPDRITGLSPRFSSLTAQNGAQIIDGGGTGNDNTSIWFVTWGPKGCQLLYPENSTAGIEREDLGKQKAYDDNNNSYMVYEEIFRAHFGVTVTDWRKVSRIANLDINALRAGTTDLYDLMIEAFHALQGVPQNQTGTASLDSGDGNFMSDRMCIYCNREVFVALHKKSNDKDNVALQLTPSQLEGQQVMTFLGIPIKRVDQIANTESRVV